MSGRSATAKQIEFKGWNNRKQRFCQISFPGDFVSEWDLSTVGQSNKPEELRLANACVFFPDEASNFYGMHMKICKCAFLYEDNDPNYHSWPLKRAPFGCKWFGKWCQNLDDAVDFDQVGIIVYKPGKLDDDIDGLGFSQRGEVKEARSREIQIVSVDVHEMRRIIEPLSMHPNYFGRATPIQIKDHLQHLLKSYRETGAIKGLRPQIEDGHHQLEKADLDRQLTSMRAFEMEFEEGRAGIWQADQEPNSKYIKGNAMCKFYIVACVIISALGACWFFLHYYWSYKYFTIAFCGDLSYPVWPAIVALARQTYDRDRGILPLSGRARFQVQWLLKFADTEALETDVGRSWVNLGVSAIIGCTYSSASHAVALEAMTKKIVQIGWASDSARFSNKNFYPYFLRTCGSSSATAESFVKLVMYFKWWEVYFLYENYLGGTCALGALQDALRPYQLTQTFSFMHYPDSSSGKHPRQWQEQLQKLWQYNIDQRLKYCRALPRIVGFYFAGGNIPTILRIAQQGDWNRRAQWISFESFEFTGAFHDGLEYWGNTVITLAERQSRASNELSTKMVEAWPRMNFEEMHKQAIPSSFITHLRKEQPNVFEQTAFISFYGDLFDAIIAALLACQNLLEKGHNVYNCRGDTLLDSLYNTSFVGATGEVSFTQKGDGTGGDRAIRYVDVIQGLGSNRMPLGSIYLQLNTTELNLTHPRSDVDLCLDIRNKTRHTKFVEMFLNRHDISGAI